MRKTIGVALTLIQTELSREFLNSLHKAARIFGFKIVVFNSVADFLSKDEPAAKNIFSMIPYESLDALVILHDTIHDSKVIDDLIMEGEARKVPVIFARKEDERTYSVSGKSRIPYERLLRHVLEEHHVRDTFFIAGKSNYDEDSLARIESYRRILSEFGIPFNEEMIECGEYREGPTKEIIDRLYKKRNGFPEAIFCSNDIMATAAIERITEYGYNVPKDVIVTGFDGMECARCSNPSLTTVHENVEELGELVVQMVNDIHKADLPISHYYYNYDTIISQSCGCERTRELYMRPSMENLYRVVRTNGSDEYSSNEWLGKVLENTSLSAFRRLVGEFLGNDQIVFLRNDDSVLLDGTDDKLVTLPDNFDLFTRNIGDGKGINYSKDKVASFIEDFFDEESICVVSTVFVKNIVIGIHVEKTRSIKEDGSKIDRHERALNHALAAVLAAECQAALLADIEKNKYIDSLTEVMNGRGLNRWFDEYKKESENHEKFAAICAFHFINGEKIQEEFGNGGFEDCVRFIAKDLRMSHPENAIIARISSLGYVVVLFAKSDKHRDELIYRCIEPFYSYIELHNTRNPNGPQIEVSSGSCNMDPGWDESLNTYINSAYNELYKNRMAQYEGKSEDVSSMDISMERGALNTLNTLFRNSMLTYVFQPIVDAHTADIIGYEALMRTTGTVSMTATEIIRIAKRNRRLDVVEEFTLNKTLALYELRERDFDGKLLFINSIAGHFLSTAALAELREKYTDILPKVVLEINEIDAMGVNELTRLRKFGSDEENVMIAIDGFGTGNANIMNLINQRPHIVKIDRSLMENIDKDSNKQMFVSNVIEFARNNNIKVLGLGIETKEELRMAIQLGVDYVQGFYTGHPLSEIVKTIGAGTRNDILEAQRLFSDF